MLQDQPDTPSDSIFEEAALWHARLRDSGQAAEQRPDFLAWAEKPQHRAAFHEVQRLWAASTSPAQVIAAEISDSVSMQRGRSGWLMHGAIAASIVFILGTGTWLLQGGVDHLRSDHVAATGEQRSIMLDDHSRILLNTDTAIAVDLRPEARRVRLFRGEAFFTVAPDPARPFIVQTGEGEVRVTGTAFNIRLADDNAVVSVTEGRVEAASHSGAPKQLKAEQQATISATGVTLPAPFDLARVSAWQRGQIVFYRTPLSEVVDELNRYHPGRVLVWNGALRDLRVSGVFDARDPATAVDVIARTLPVRVTRLAGGLTLLR